MQEPEVFTIRRSSRRIVGYIRQPTSISRRTNRPRYPSTNRRLAEGQLVPYQEHAQARSQSQAVFNILCDLRPVLD